MAAVRRASATWQGDLLSGNGEVSAETSHVFSNLPVSWKARTEAGQRLTSPEELIAAAHASCFAMALSNELAKAGSSPQRLEVTASVTFDQTGSGWQISSSALTVQGKVPGMDASTFQQAADAAKDGCPVSKALHGNVQLSVTATLET